MNGLNRFINILFIFLCIGFTFCVLMMTSCYSYPTEVNDPEAQTPGYKLFTGTTNDLHIKFEYPSNWSRMSVDKGKTSRSIRFLSSNSATTVASDVNKSNGGFYEYAIEILQYQLSLKEHQPEFKILSRNKIQLGQAEGEEVIYSYHYEGSDPHSPPVPIYTNTPSVARLIDVDYKGRIYDLNFISAATEYEKAKSGFERIVATFHFLE